MGAHLHLPKRNLFRDDIARRKTWANTAFSMAFVFEAGLETGAIALHAALAPTGRYPCCDLVALEEHP